MGKDEHFWFGKHVLERCEKLCNYIFRTEIYRMRDCFFTETAIDLQMYFLNIGIMTDDFEIMYHMLFMQGSNPYLT